jgi:hypothetical protein
VTAPEKGARLPEADREETPGQLPPEIVSQDFTQTSQSLKSVQQGKLVWKCNRGKVPKSEKMVTKWCALPATMMSAMVMSLCLMALAAAFLAYDCSNNTNVVEAYNLLEPAPCHISVMDHRYERVVQAEIVHRKRERTIPVFRCHVVESVFSQYCGHSSVAGVTRYLRFREPLIVDPM